MKKPMYFNKNIVVINYTKDYPTNVSGFIESETFSKYLALFLEDLKVSNLELYNWTTRVFSENIIDDIKRLAKSLLVFDIKDIEHKSLNDSKYLLELIETAYDFWRKKERYSIVSTYNNQGLQLANFIQADQDYNQMILDFYRTLQEKIQGYKNKIYRQLQAGTNAALLLRHYNLVLNDEYSALKDIPFINTMMLRTPLIFHPKSNKRLGTFTKTDKHLINEFINDGNYLCYPAKVGELTILIYFHIDYLTSVVGLSNLFELASEEDCLNNKVDGIILFGNQDNLNETVYEYDEANDLWIGKVSYAPVIEYFGYLKKMSLTLFNLAMLKRNKLAIHGAMINVYFKDGTKKGIVLMGDSGAGKSETIEALSQIGSDIIIKQEIIFDDMGAMFIEDGKILASGTEIGAFVRLDDLDKGSAYRDMDRSIFFNPESLNARVVIPTTPYDIVCDKHQVDCFMYANNYDDKYGLTILDDINVAKEIFKEGKRFALGTTQEKGISKTYFANPFGLMQSIEETDPLIDTMFDKLYENKIIVGEVYSRLGVDEKDGLDKAALALLGLFGK